MFIGIIHNESCSLKIYLQERTIKGGQAGASCLSYTYLNSIGCGMKNQYEKWKLLKFNKDSNELCEKAG